MPEGRLVGLCAGPQSRPLQWRAMQLEAGSTLGDYEILVPLGAGGMGEVYRALDPRLEREVAIKLLPPDFAAEPSRLARFERDAKSLAALRHPNVATLYGFEEAEDLHFLVMELVPGEDLAERLTRGPLAPNEAIPVFLQIAEGLEAAHESGIVHRDLKPANVKVDPEGRVQILDFGLATAAQEPAAGEGVQDLTQSPTAIAATVRGEILGTAAYMSPEQATGRAVDKRTDARYLEPGYLVFARGGRLLAIRFDAETGQVSGEATSLLRGASMDSGFTQVQFALARNGTLAAVPGGDRAVASVGWVDRTGATGRLPLPPRLYGTLDLSFDDRHLALHVGDVNDYVLLYDLELEEERRLVGSRDAGWPRWSPDGERIAVSRGGGPDGALVIMDLKGSNPLELVRRPFMAPHSWSPDGRFVVVQDWITQRLGIVPSDGSEPVRWIEDESVWGTVSPDGLWMAHGDMGNENFWIRSFPDAEPIARSTHLRGGGEFLWCRACDEIFNNDFEGGAGWMAAPASFDPEPRVGAPTLAFEAEFVDTRGHSYAVTSDGQRLYAVMPTEPPERNRIRLITNLRAELERLLPTP